MIIANWKANGDSKSNKDWSTIFLNSLSKEVTSSIGIAPSHIHFMQLLDIFKNSSLKIGLQDVDFENGARTGSISASMASEMNCSFSILGHSERRTLFNEDNKLIKKKIEACLLNNINPILCIGESGKENTQGQTRDVLKRQITESIAGTELNQDFTIAYEPIWAIGTGNTPIPKDINAIHEFIKDVVQSASANNKIPKVLYGGSVNDINANDFLVESNIDGALVGGASLDASVFANIVNIYEGLNKK